MCQYFFKFGVLLKDNYHIEDLISKNPQAFRNFVDENKKRVINICFSFLHDQNDSEDVAQEVFIEIFNSIANFRKDANINTWLYRIAVNKSLDFIRKKNRKKRATKVLSIFGLSSKDNDSIIDDANPYKLMVHKEKADSIQKAIDKLPENQKAVFILNKIENRSYKEIADVLGTSVSAVDSLFQRAKKNLQKFLLSEGL